MVLLQIPIYGYINDANSIMNTHVYTSISVPFFGNYKIKFLGYSIGFSTFPSNILRIDSINLFTNAIPSKLYIGSNPANSVLLSNDLEFISNLNGVIDIDILNANDGSIPANFQYCLLNLNLEKIV
jgi:hypothetical protein